jgi:hypothetical protein
LKTIFLSLAMLTSSVSYAQFSLTLANNSKTVPSVFVLSNRDVSVATALKPGQRMNFAEIPQHEKLSKYMEITIFSGDKVIFKRPRIDLDAWIAINEHYRTLETRVIIYHLDVKPTDEMVRLVGKQMANFKNGLGFIEEVAPYLSGIEYWKRYTGPELAKKYLAEFGNFLCAFDHWVQAGISNPEQLKAVWEIISGNGNDD